MYVDSWGFMKSFLKVLLGYVGSRKEGFLQLVASEKNVQQLRNKMKKAIDMVY